MIYNRKYTFDLHFLPILGTNFLNSWNFLSDKSNKGISFCS